MKPHNKAKANARYLASQQPKEEVGCDPVFPEDDNPHYYEDSYRREDRKKSIKQQHRKS